MLLVAQDLSRNPHALPTTLRIPTLRGMAFQARSYHLLAPEPTRSPVCPSHKCRQLSDPIRRYHPTNLTVSLTVPLGGPTRGSTRHAACLKGVESRTM